MRPLSSLLAFWRTTIQRGSSRRVLLGLLIVIAVLIGVGWAYRSSTSRSPSAATSVARAQPVRVAPVVRGDYPVWISALGTAIPRQSVTVRSRVDGELLRLHVQEGQQVRAGQLLAQIDPRAFEVQLLQAQGQLAKDAALLKNAQLDAQRYQDLLAKDAIARQQVDTQAALVRQYQGALDVDRAQVAAARLQLDYSRIRSPVSGRVGLRQVDPGNIVRASDSAGLMTITQEQPMTVLFAIPQTQLADVQNSLRAQQEALPVEAWDRDMKQRLAQGRLLTLDNAIDTSTGTVKARAQFPNTHRELFPHQFIQVRLLSTVLKGVFIIPSAALLRSSRGDLVYVVQPDNTVRSLAVRTLAADAQQVAIFAPPDAGLMPGTLLVTDGLDKLREGSRVEQITSPASSPPSTAPPPPAPSVPHRSTP